MLARRLRHWKGLLGSAAAAATKGEACREAGSAFRQRAPPQSAAPALQQRRSYSYGPVRQYQHFKRKPFWEEGRQRYIVVGVGALGTVYYVAHLEEVPYTHRRHAVFVSPQTEIALGLQTFAEVKAQAEAEGKLLPQWHPAVKSVQRVGLRIAAVAGNGHGGGRQDHMKNLKWEFAVIDEPDTPNAFVVPGGKVVFYTGLLRLLQMHEDEIAAVLGHEVAHVLARHVGEKLSSAALVTLVQIAVYLLLGISMPSELYQLTLFLPNSRKQETEADVIGIMLAARACYDPKAAIVVFTKLGRKEEEMLQGRRVPQFMLTHPLSKARVQAISANLPRAQQEYELAGCNAPRGFFS